MGRTSAKVRAMNRVRIFRNGRTRSTPFGPKLTFLCISYHSGASRTVWLPHETRWKTGRTSAKVRATKSHRTFRNERTRSTPLDTILTFWCIRTIWVHSGLFSCLTKLGAKQAELVQKFVPRSGVGIFRNECTRSTPLDPKLTFWCIRTIWVLPGPFGCLTKLGVKRAELV